MQSINGAIFNGLERRPKPDFKVTPEHDVEYGINGTRATHIYAYSG